MASMTADDGLELKHFISTLLKGPELFAWAQYSYLDLQVWG